MKFGWSKNHDVPSRAIDTSQEAAGFSPQTRFVTIAVFGVSVTYLNVTFLLPPMGHAPVNVAMRIVFFVSAGVTLRNDSGTPAEGVTSARRTTRAIRSADSRVNCTAENGPAMYQAGTSGNSEEKLASGFTRRGRMSGRPVMLMLP